MSIIINWTDGQIVQRDEKLGKKKGKMKEPYRILGFYEVNDFYQVT
jgi:hypothetical protein